MVLGRARDGWRLAQFNFIAILPFADANVGRSAPAHVEAYGTRTHYTHDEANCAACVTRQLIGRIDLLVNVSLPPVSEAELGSARVSCFPAISLDRFSGHTAPEPLRGQRGL